MPKKRKRVARKAAPAADAAPTRDREDEGVPSPVEVSVVPLAKLTPLADNPRSHTTRGIDFIASSLDRVGAARSGVIDEDSVILAGNGMREAAVQAGYRDTIVVRVDGTRPVFVQRANLSPPQKSRVIIDDNRASELSGWNARLLDYAERDPSIQADWTAPEWCAAVGPRPVTEGRTDPDATVAHRPTTIVRGDQFRLDAHHLRCGDSTDSADVQALLGDRKPCLMATDPPYGVQYDPKWRAGVDGGKKHAVGPVANDDRVDWTAAFQLFPGDVAYCWHASLHGGVVATALRTAGLEIRSQIIWCKQHFVFSRADYHWRHEVCWYAVRTGRTSRWKGDRTQTTVWSVPNNNPFGGDATSANAPTGHSTQKPVALFEAPLLNHTEPGEAMYDPFAGSGTALIAAERLGRVCYAMEILPMHVQSILDRWEAFTGKAAVKVSGG